MSISNVVSSGFDGAGGLDSKSSKLEGKAAQSFNVSLDGVSVDQSAILRGYPQTSPGADNVDEVLSLEKPALIAGAVQSFKVEIRHQGVKVYESPNLSAGQTALKPYSQTLNATPSSVNSRIPTEVRSSIASDPIGGATPGQGAVSNLTTLSSAAISKLPLFDGGWAVATPIPGGDAANGLDMVYLDVKEPILNYLAGAFSLSTGVLNGTEAPPAFITESGGHIAFRITIDELKELQTLTKQADAPEMPAADRALIAEQRDALASRIEDKFLLALNNAIQDKRAEAGAAATDADATPPRLPSTIDSDAVTRTPYTLDASTSSLDYTREFNSISKTNVALTYTTRDPGGGELYIETAHNLTPSQARALIGQLRQDGTLSNEVSDDLLFRGNGIGGWTKPDGTTATYQEDLAVRDANIYFGGLTNHEKLDAAQNGVAAINGKPGTALPADVYPDLMRQASETNGPDSGTVTLVVPQRITIPYGSAPSPYNTIQYDVSVLYTNLTPDEVLAVLNNADGAGLLTEPVARVLADNGLSMASLDNRRQILAQQSGTNGQTETTTSDPALTETLTTSSEALNPGTTIPATAAQAQIVTSLGVTVLNVDDKGSIIATKTDSVSGRTELFTIARDGTFKLIAQVPGIAGTPDQLTADLDALTILSNDRQIPGGLNDQGIQELKDQGVLTGSFFGPLPLHVRLRRSAERLSTQLNELEVGATFKLGSDDFFNPNWIPDFSLTSEEGGFTNTRVEFTKLSDGRFQVVQLAGEGNLAIGGRDWWNEVPNGETIIVAPDQPIHLRDAGTINMDYTIKLQPDAQLPRVTQIADSVKRFVFNLEVTSTTSFRKEHGNHVRYPLADPIDSLFPPTEFPTGFGFDNLKFNADLNVDGTFKFTLREDSSPIQYRLPEYNFLNRPDRIPENTPWNTLDAGQSIDLPAGAQVRFLDTGTPEFDHIVTIPWNNKISELIRPAMSATTAEDFIAELFRIDVENVWEDEYTQLMNKAILFDVGSPFSEQSRLWVQRPGMTEDALLFHPIVSGLPSTQYRVYEWLVGLPSGTYTRLHDALNPLVPMSFLARRQSMIDLTELIDVEGVQPNFVGFWRNRAATKADVVLEAARSHYETNFGDQRLPFTERDGPSLFMLPIVDRLGQYLASPRTSEDLRSARVETLEDIDQLGRSIIAGRTFRLTLTDVNQLRVIAQKLDVNFEVESGIGMIYPPLPNSPGQPTISITYDRAPAGPSAFPDLDEQLDRIPDSTRREHRLVVKYPPNWQAENQFPIDDDGNDGSGDDLTPGFGAR